MILIVTHKEDYTADYLIRRLNEQQRKYIRLNTDDIDWHNYNLNSENDFTLSLQGYDRYDAVWYRRVKPPNFHGLTFEDVLYLLGEYEALYANLFNAIRSERWMSKPSSIRFSENKAVQLRVAHQLGFNIPETIISSDKLAVKRFIDLHSQFGVVVKPLYSGRIESGHSSKLVYTNRLTDSDIREFDEYDLTPCIFQREIPKAYEIRVTVVGTHVFAAKVDSQSNVNTAIDWRREKLPFQPYDLPASLEDKCIRLLKSLDVAFGALDIIRGKDGKYYFLEINPNGQWAWIEADTELPISAAIIDYLYAETR